MQNNLQNLLQHISSQVIKFEEYKTKHVAELAAAIDQIVGKADAAQLIATYTLLDDMLDAGAKVQSETVKPLRAACMTIKDRLLAIIHQVGGDAIKTPNGTAYTSTIVTPKVESRQDYLEWLFALTDEEWTEFGDAMLQVGAPQKDALVEYMADHDGLLPPGIATSSLTRINIRRS